MITRLRNMLFDREIELQERMFRVTILAGGIMAIIGALGNILVMDFASAIIPVGMQLGVVIIALIATFKYQKREFASVLVGLVITVKVFPDMFFLSGGIEGGAALWFILIFFYDFIVFSGKKLAFFVGLALVVDGYTYVRAYRNPELITPLASEWAVYFDSFLAVMGVGLVIGSLLKFQMKMYEAERRIAKEQKEEIESISDSRNEFFSNMSHEIRTPLNTILGLNEMILRESKEEETKEYAIHIQKATQILINLVNDVLDFSQMEISQLELEETEYETKRLFEEVADTIKISAAEKGLEFALDLDENVPSVLIGDQRRIKQILWNLLTNAVKYTEEGSVTLSVEGEKRTEQEVVLKVSIADTGQGIRKEDFDKLYDAFERVEEWEKANVEGAGLGLAIVKRLLFLMNGDITVDSIYTKGSVFTVTLPQKIGDEKPIGAYVMKRGQVERGLYQPWFEAPEAQVLVVDDNEMDTLVVSKLLQATKVNVEVASSGEECLKKTKQKYYHAILLDYFMPGMNGVSALNEIRKQENGLCRDSAVIVLTTRTITDAKELYRKYSFDGCLEKPLDSEKLEKVLLQCLPRDIIEQRQSLENRKSDQMQWVVKRRKKRVCITSDCVCDLPEELLEKYGVSLMYLYIRTDKGRFADTREIDSDNLLQYLSDENRFVRSDSVSVEEYEEFFAEKLTQAEEVIHISMAEHAGKSYAMAVAAAKGFGHVHVIDSGHISGGQGLIVLYAAKLLQDGRDVASICNEINRIKGSVANKFLMPTSRFFYLNGYTNALTEKICDTFRLHPVLSMLHGKLTIVGVRVGTLENAWKRYIRYHLRKKKRIQPEIVIITHVGCTVRQQEVIREEVLRCFPFQKVILQKASLSNGCNAGIGTVGVAFFTKTQ